MSQVRHNEKFAKLTNGIRICYSVHGPEWSPSVLLIAGLGLQLVYWPASLINRLVDNNFRIICFDNRDAGRSTRMSTPHPGRLQQILRMAPRDAYSLEDMADDCAHLLDYLSVKNVHLVGMSMGGMIAQTLSYRHPSRANTLASIFASRGNPKVGQPDFQTLCRMMLTKNPRTQEEAVKHYCAFMKHIGDPDVIGAKEQWEIYAERAWQRNGKIYDKSAIYRQIGAIIKSGDRSPSLSRILAPTIVIHGEQDRMVSPTGGLATVLAINRAHYKVVPGLRHQIDEKQGDVIARLIIKNIRKGRSIYNET